MLRVTPHQKFVHEFQALAKHSKIGENLARKFAASSRFPSGEDERFPEFLVS